MISEIADAPDFKERANISAPNTAALPTMPSIRMDWTKSAKLAGASRDTTARGVSVLR
jgi:hypothetical protein